MIRFSVIIPYTDERQNIHRTWDYIKRQSLSLNRIEIIILDNCVSDLSEENITSLEDENPSGIISIKVEEKKSAYDLINIGLSHVTGDYVVFLEAGDAINDKLLGAIADLCDKLSDTPDIFSYNITRAMDYFEYFMDDPFDTTDAEVYYLSDVQSRRQFLINSKLDENIFCHIYRRDFLLDVDQPVSEILVYPLLYLAGLVCIVPENGYCSYGLKEGEFDFAKRVSNIIENQTSLYELLTSIPEIMSDYGDIVTAHFIREYYLKILYLAQALDIKKQFSLASFQALQYVCLKIAPKWIENEVIYSYSQSDKELLKLLYKTFTSDHELHETLYEKSLVSVVMGTYNRADKILRAIDNILSQTYQRFELIIIDDCSDDDTQSLVQKFSDPRIKYIRNDHNLGPAGTRNVGIKIAKGEYIVINDDDDLCRLEKIEMEIDFFRQDDLDSGMVFHETINHINRIENRGGDVVIMPSRRISDIKKKGYIFPALLPWNYVTFPSMMVRRECYEQVGLLNETLYAFEDWEITLRIVRNYRAGFIKKPLYDYYQSSHGTLFKSDMEHRKKVVAALDYIDKEYEEDRKSYGIESIKK
ncbi:glycosyltransferase family 2 protein [Butyrivibrio sp. XBB1001]|uniref:glycosyltransferase family 2 protein n=1 Tax=Butyrivibrio sp. XBB1001 TaxID=1280682 RepID=UPI0003FA9CCA|nr:glycosyltransferase [Butyrivibrio sp. XBB1001]